jgi:phosphoglycolate phosphatase-like HAD superfamily hydrolase
MHQLALDEVNVPFFPKLLLFDFDGTLFNTIDSIRFSLEHTFQSFSDPVPPPQSSWIR